MNDNFSSPEFVRLVQNNDTKALESLVREYTAHLFKGATGLGFSHDEASELIQNVWSSFFSVASNFKGNSHIRTFLFGILYNKAKEYKREFIKMNKHDDLDTIFDEHFDENGDWKNHIASPERFLQAVQTMDIIEKCIENLPLNQKMAFCLKEVDGHGSVDICNILEVSVTNLGVLLFRAKNRLRECIEAKSGN
jgi:RNA polymerase sigma-70 factor, ECF subfamily